MCLAIQGLTLLDGDFDLRTSGHHSTPANSVAQNISIFMNIKVEFYLTFSLEKGVLTKLPRAEGLEENDGGKSMVPYSCSSN